MKNKNAFTLIELLAVIVLLGIIVGISVPVISNVITSSKQKSGLAEANLIYKEIEKYCDTFDINVSDNINSTICSNQMTINDVNKIINLGNAKILKLEYLNNRINWLEIETNGFTYGFNGNNMELSYKRLYKDKSGANAPKLLNNMVPIKYDGTKWIYADVTEEWYDYDKKEWANAVVLSKSGKSKTVGQEITISDIDLWYVWIPRYKYQLFDSTISDILAPPEINVIFEKNLDSTGDVTCIDKISSISGAASEVCSKDEIGNWYTHPAFTSNKGLSNSKELEGIWVGKFEISDPTNPNSDLVNKKINHLVIKPGIKSLRNQILNNLKVALEKIDYDYHITNGKSYMIRNMEWGAITYLGNSKYGKIVYERISRYINFTGGGEGNTYITNLNQSTTNNVYGIYDMGEGAEEFVLSNIVNNSGKFNSALSELNDYPIENYDKYSFNTDYNISNSGKLGDATKETAGWFNNYATFPNNEFSWFIRGGEIENGHEVGIYTYGQLRGEANPYRSSRSVLHP